MALYDEASYNTSASRPVRGSITKPPATNGTTAGVTGSTGLLPITASPVQTGTALPASDPAVQRILSNAERAAASTAQIADSVAREMDPQPRSFFNDAATFGGDHDDEEEDDNNNNNLSSSWDDANDLDDDKEEEAAEADAGESVADPYRRRDEEELEEQRAELEARIAELRSLNGISRFTTLGSRLSTLERRVANADQADLIAVAADIDAIEREAVGGDNTSSDPQPNSWTAPGTHPDGSPMWTYEAVNPPSLPERQSPYPGYEYDANGNLRPIRVQDPDARYPEQNDPFDWVNGVDRPYPLETWPERAEGERLSDEEGVQATTYPRLPNHYLYVEHRSLPTLNDVAYTLNDLYGANSYMYDGRLLVEIPFQGTFDATSYATDPIQRLVEGLEPDWKDIAEDITDGNLLKLIEETGAVETMISFLDMSLYGVFGGHSDYPIPDAAVHEDDWEFPPEDPGLLSLVARAYRDPAAEEALVDSQVFAGQVDALGRLQGQEPELQRNRAAYDLMSDLLDPIYVEQGWGQRPVRDTSGEYSVADVDRVGFALLRMTVEYPELLPMLDQWRPYWAGIRAQQ